MKYLFLIKFIIILRIDCGWLYDKDYLIVLLFYWKLYFLYIKIKMNQHQIQVNTILEFFKSKKTRLTALQTLLGLTEIPEWISTINKSNAIQLCIRLLESDELNSEETSTALQILVNLSSEESSIESFLEAKATIRLSRLFLIKSEKELNQKKSDEDNLFSIDLNMELISQGILLNNHDLSLSDTSMSSHTYEIKKILDKYVYNDKKNFSSLTEEQIVMIPFILMILTNLTSVSEKAQKQFFGSDKEESDKMKGLFFIKMLDQFFENVYKEEMDFMSSIIANVSALKEGRVFILENHLYEIILAQFDKLNNFKMVNMLRVFRNCCFEFEAFEKELIVREGFMLLLLFKILIETNSVNKEEIYLGVSCLDGIHFTHFKKETAFQEKEAINDLIIDIFVILTNTQTAFPVIVKKGLKEVWMKIKNQIPTDYNSSIEDRVFVISNFLDSHK